MNDTNVGPGMVPHKKNCKCLECENERLHIENKNLKNLRKQNMETIELAFMALNGGTGKEWRKDFCKCDHDVGMVPCEYCAIYDALKIYE